MAQKKSVNKLRPGHKVTLLGRTFQIKHMKPIITDRGELIEIWFTDGTVIRRPPKAKLDLV